MTELHCPYCNRRLLDFELQGVIKLKIKCPKCGKILELKLKKGA